MICSAFFCFIVLGVRAHEAAPARPSAAASKAVNLDYPDSPGGLEHLAKDIMKAQKDGNESRAMELAQSMILPDPAAW